MKKSPPTSRAGTDTPSISVRPSRKRLARKHVVLDLPSQLELALDALLANEGALMCLDLGGHLVEGVSQLPNFVPGFHGHAGRVFAVRDASHTAGQRR